MSLFVGKHWRNGRYDPVFSCRIIHPPSHAVSANRILWVYAGFWCYHGILLVHPQDSVGAFGAKWLTKWLHHAKAQPHRGVLRWEWGNKDVHLVTTFVFCHASKYYFFSRSFIVKLVRKMRKSGTGHADGIGFRGHNYVMHSKNSSLLSRNKMIALSNIDSYSEKAWACDLNGITQRGRLVDGYIITSA